MAAALARAGVEACLVPPGRLFEPAMEKAYGDLLLVLSGELLDVDAVRKLRRRAGAVAVWVTEDPYTIDRRPPEWVEAFDVVFTNERCAVEIYGGRRAVYLPWCTDPSVYRPASAAGRQPEWDVLFVGTGFPDRVRLLNALAPALRGLRVKLVGNFNRGEVELDPGLKASVMPPVSSPESVARLYGAARICLNLHRSPRPLAVRENLNRRAVPALSPNSRLFDIAACGAFQLVDDTRPEMLRLYETGREVVTFSSARELREKIHYYLQHAAERKAIARAARQRTLRDHTFDRRVAEILRCTGLSSGRPVQRAYTVAAG